MANARDVAMERGDSLSALGLAQPGGDAAALRVKPLHARTLRAEKFLDETSYM